jgi:tetratricopeptide (TPR) repeat protein
MVFCVGVLRVACLTGNSHFMDMNFYKILSPHFVYLVFAASVCLFFENCTQAQQLDTNQVKHVAATDFWNDFAGSILEKLKVENNPSTRSAILLRGRQLIETNLSDPFACKAMYCMGVAYYRQNDFVRSREYCEKALKLPETQSGNYRSAWNLIAECYEASSNYVAAIKASEEVLKCNAPDIMKADLDRVALTRKADLLLRKANVSNGDRREAETVLAPLTEIKSLGTYSQLQGQLVRARIENLKKSRNIQDAYEIGDYFVKKNPSDPWAGVICSDLCKLTNHYAPRDQLETWVGFFETNHVKNCAGLINLKEDLMNAYARDGKYEQAVKLGNEIQSFQKATDDPVPWGKIDKESVANVVIVSHGVDLQRRGLVAATPKEKEQYATRRVIVLVVLALLTVVPLLALIFKVFKTRDSK